MKPDLNSVHRIFPSNGVVAVDEAVVVIELVAVALSVELAVVETLLLPVTLTDVVAEMLPVLDPELVAVELMVVTSQLRNSPRPACVIAVFSWIASAGHSPVGVTTS